MKKISLLFVFFYSVIFWAQSTNRHIKNASGTLLPDIFDYCEGESFSLKVDATATATGDYIDGGSDFPIAELEKGENKTIVFKNTTPSNPHKFSEPIDIGFSFSFYGKTYDKVVVGNYGRLVFTNVAELNNMSNDAIYEDRQFSGISPSTRVVLPSTEYNKVYRDETKMLNLAQIFFGYTYLYKASWDTESKKYNYRTGVFAGVKGLLVEFKGVVQNTGSGPGRGFDSSVLILEDGRIIVYVKDRTSVNQNALIGIQNEDATKYLVPNPVDKYNNGRWQSQDRNIFIFEPNQNLTPEVKWLVNGVEKHIGTSYNYTPSGTSETLKAVITLKDDAGAVVKTEESMVAFHPIEQPQVMKTEAANCGEPAVLKITNYNARLSYEWFSTANPSPGSGKGETFNATASGTYRVRVKDISCNKESDDISVNIDSPIPPFGYTNGHIFSYCETNPTKVVNLLRLLNYSLDSTQYTVKFYENSVEISDYSNYTFNSGDSKNITVKVETLAGATPSCSTTLNFTVEYQAFPTQVSLDSRSLCEGTSQYTVGDFKADHPAFSAFDITFWNNGNLLGEMVNPSELSTVKVRAVKNGFTCQFDYDLSFRFHPSVIANTPTTILTKKCESNPTFDFSVLKNEINNSTEVEITFHKTMEDARNGANAVDGSTSFPVGISPPIYIRVKNINTGCVAQTFPSFNVEVFAKPQPKSTSISMTQCAGETFNLTQSITDLFSTQNTNIQYEIKYFSENGVELSSAEVLSYTPNTLGFKPYIEISYDGQCADEVVFDLKYNALPTSSVSEISVCDEKTYSLNDFKNKVVANPADYEFLNSDESVMMASFNLSSLPKIVQFYLKRKDTGCRSELLAVTFKQLSPLPLDSNNVSIKNCDTQGDRFDGIASFDLTSVQTQISTANGARFTFYKDAARTQIIATPTAFSSADAIVYVKVEVDGFCPSSAEVKLNVKTPTRSTTLKEKYFICYGSDITIDAGSEYIAFSWSDGATEQIATFTQAGSYSVTLTNAEGCSYTHYFEISDENQPKIQQIHQDNSKIEVIATGLYPIEYSFNNGAVFSSSNVLQNPTAQEYTVRVRSVLPDGSYCEGAPKHLYAININNVITPNDDGKNDIWRIKNLDKMEQVEILISDRYGKPVFHTTDKNKLYWDGKQNGRPLPTASYWYVVKWLDTATQKSEVRQGWILLKNRD
ncbi:T9SS type B sorting domain-containing protein [Bergeyella porcorum]|uniref:T9SS type B sorting domain-containing protein n=1 Tax=Bergeyella porcorum TaxID=1735111 RepID=UPI0035ECEE96